MTRRALLVRPGPNFSVEDVADGWVEGLEANGWDVQIADLSGILAYHQQALMACKLDDERTRAGALASAVIRQMCFDWWPELVVIVSAFFISPETFRIIRARGMKVVTVLTESPYEDDNQIKIAALADVAVVNDPTNLDRFPSNTIYLPHAYRPSIHRPQEPVPEAVSDFCFVGTAYPSRIEFFEQVDFDGIDVALAGNWQGLSPDSPLHKHLAHDIESCCPNDWTAKLYASTQASCNVYRTEAQRPELSEGWAMTPREVELAASGTFYLAQPRGENREVLPMVPAFDGPQDFGEQLRWWLAHPTERAHVVREARAAVADRTFENHATQLLQHL